MTDEEQDYAHIPRRQPFETPNQLGWLALLAGSLEDEEFKEFWDAVGTAIRIGASAIRSQL